MGAKKYNVAYITDAGYLLPTKVSLRSLVDSVGDEEIDIHIIHTGIADQALAELEAMQTDKVRVRLIDGGDHFADLWISHEFLTKTALYKFLLPKFLPELDRVLYIDGDTLVYPGFLGIFDESLEGVYAVVVADMRAMRLYYRHEKLGLPLYFNSGVMLLNLVKMREERIDEKLIDYIRPGGDTLFLGDQDALNAVFGKSVRYTHLRFNCNSKDTYAKFFTEREVLDFFGDGQEDLYHPAIRHLTGGEKPWKSSCAPDAEDWCRHVAAGDILQVARNYVKAALDERDVCDALKTGHLSQYPFGENMILPVTGGIELEGFHPPEQNGRWTSGRARIQIRNRDLKGNTTGLVLWMKAIAMGEDRSVRVLFCGTEVWKGIVPCRRREVIEIRLAPSIADESSVLDIVPDGETFSPVQRGISNDSRPLALFFEYIELSVCTSRRLDGVEQGLKAQGGTIAAHGAAITAHGAAITAHGSTIASHGSAIASHGSAIASHRSAIADHGSAIADHGAMIAQIRQSLDKAHAGLGAAYAELQSLHAEIVALRNSKSYKIGRAITYVPRKIWSVFTRRKPKG